MIFWTTKMGDRALRKSSLSDLGNAAQERVPSFSVQAVCEYLSEFLGHTGPADFGVPEFVMNGLQGTR